MEILLRKQQADKIVHKKAPSQMLTWVLNTPLLFEDSKVFNIKSLLKSVIYLKYLTSFWFLKHAIKHLSIKPFDLINTIPLPKPLTIPLLTTC